jgi:hypothetical protein
MRVVTGSSAAAATPGALSTRPHSRCLLLQLAQLALTIKRTAQLSRFQLAHTCTFARLLLISSQRQCSSQSVFESALFVEKYPRAEIRITIHVMQVFIQLLLPAAARPACSILHPKSHVNQIDGSVRCACINAASMALISAGIEMRDTVCACSAGILDTTIVTDLTQSEENACVTAVLSAHAPAPRTARFI